MSKQLILMKDVEGLGIVGDVVSVAPGYARNYLLPHGFAQPASQRLVDKLADARAAREAELMEEKERAEAFAEKVNGTELTIRVKTSAEGRLYGSVGASEIADAARKAGLKIEEKQVNIGAPYRQLGTYDVRVRLHPEVTATMKLEVAAEEEED